LLAAVTAVVRFGIYPPVKAIFSLMNSPTAAVQFSLALTAGCLIASGIVSLLAAWLALAPPSESVVAWPIPAGAWHQVNLRSYSVLASLVNLVLVGVVLLASTQTPALGRGPQVALLAGGLAVVVWWYQGFEAVWLGLQKFSRRLQIGVAAGASLTVVGLGIWAHARQWDQSTAAGLATVLINRPGSSLAAIAAALMAGGGLLAYAKARLIRQLNRQFLTLESSRSRPSRAYVIWPLPPLTRVSLVALWRDRRVTAWAAASLSLVLLATGAAYYYRQPLIINFVVAITPVFLAMIISGWLTRLRAYLGVSRLSVYALPVSPARVTAFQALAAVILGSLALPLIELQLKLFHLPLGIKLLISHWFLLLAWVAGYYLISCLVARHAQQFTANSILESLSLIVTVVVYGLYSYAQDRGMTWVASSALVLLAAALLLLAAYAIEKRTGQRRLV
jgi:hypothetical protein